VNPVFSASLLAGALAAEHRSSLRLMISQPLCGGLLTGIVLGNLHDGLLAGALVQMLFLGMVAVRGMRAPDLTLGGVAAAALYVLVQRRTGGAASGLALFLSIAAALGVAIMGGAVQRLWEARSFFLARWAMRSADGGRFWLASLLHFLTVAVHGIVGFAIVAGAVAVCVPLAAAAAGSAAGRWGEPLSSLPVLAPFVGAGSLLALNLSRVRVFLFCSGFAIVLLVMLFRG
jgi:mannose/fructose/N-acetylgalactosamine-specific phosphotransferase system component IIC